MARIEVTHREHLITYSENEDVWRCDKMDVDAATLGKLKDKLNRIDNAARKTTAIPVLVPNSYMGSAVEKAIITSMADDTHVWVRKERNGHYGKERSREKVDRIWLDNEETRAALIIFQKADREAYAARKRADDARKAIPVATMEQIRALTNEPRNDGAEDAQ